MGDKGNVKLVGEVTILKDDIVIFKENNAIQPDAAEVLLRSLIGVPIKSNIDTIKLYGDFVEIEKNIVNTTLDLVNDPKSVTFIAQVLETDFSGTISQMDLIMSNFNLTLAIKESLEILKDDSTRLEVRWKISIQVN